MYILKDDILKCQNKISLLLWTVSSVKLRYDVNLLDGMNRSVPKYKTITTGKMQKANNYQGFSFLNLLAILHALSKKQYSDPFLLSIMRVHSALSKRFYKC